MKTQWLNLFIFRWKHDFHGQPASIPTRVTHHPLTSTDRSRNSSITQSKLIFIIDRGETRQTLVSQLTETLYSCADVPAGCNRFDDECARSEGKRGKDDYWDNDRQWQQQTTTTTRQRQIQLQLQQQQQQQQWSNKGGKRWKRWLLRQRQQQWQWINTTTMTTMQVGREDLEKITDKDRNLLTIVMWWPSYFKLRLSNIIWNT